MRLILLISTVVVLTSTSVIAGPVFDAAKNGDSATLARLLDDGADVNEPNIMPPLQIAAFHGYVDVLKLLIDEAPTWKRQARCWAPRCTLPRKRAMPRPLRS